MNAPFIVGSRTLPGSAVMVIRIGTALAGITAALGLATLAGSRIAAQAECDRGCLSGIVDAYLAAVVAHEPSRAPLARGLRFTENTGVLDVGEGLWVGASEAPTTFKIYVPDPGTGQVGFIGVMKEFDRPVMLALRLRVLNGLIVDAEHIVVRSLRESGLENLVRPRPVFSAAVPAARRVPRAEMIRIADSYYDSLSAGNAALTPYADDCVRHENGVQTSTNRTPPRLPAGIPAAQQGAFLTLGRLGCAAQADSKMFSYITSIDLRRIQIVDEQTGLVFGLSMFRHLGKLRTLAIEGVPGLTSMPMDFGPVDLQAAHVFRIAGGRLHEIEAVGHTLPYKSNSGWER
jgi:hypothetical protein